MSFDIIHDAYRTRLGNLPAKSILGLLADQVNAEGFGWPSLKFIADRCEIQLRTVRRVLQVFGEIGLAVKVDRGKGKTPGLQLALDKLGSDLRAEFASAYGRAQGRKAAPENGLTDRARSVSQTTEAVSQTLFAVCETAPPDPLNGGTPNDPLRPLPPQSPHAIASGEMGERADEPSDGTNQFTAEERAWIKAKPKADRAMWANYLRKQRERQEIEVAEGALLRARYATRSAAIGAVMRDCAFVAGPRPARNPLPAILGQVLDAEAERGESLWRAGPRLVKAWTAYLGAPRDGRGRFGAVKFFRDGHWREWG